MPVINVSFYQFVDLSTVDLAELRERILKKATALGLKGTVLLATEGLNAFVAGSRESIDGFKIFIESLNYFSDLPYKESESGFQPFNRMLVKIKKEIITMGIPWIRPAKFTGRRVSSKQLVEWLDSKKEVVFLDTRNDYEYKIGTFENSVLMNLKTFRQFPVKVRELDPALKQKTVVTFCTGGIRCEKASAFLEKEGFKDVYQLDGGILRYFEETGGKHYNGQCFVFDYRVAVERDLKQADTILCFSCQMPVTVEEQKLSSFKVNVSCLHCIDGKVKDKAKIADSVRKEIAELGLLEEQA